MEPAQPKSMVMPILLSVLISAIVFGGVGYYIGQSMGSNNIGTQTTTYTTPTPTATTTATATTSSTDETSNWETYSSSQNGFTFKHPANWEVVTTTGTEGVNFTARPKGITEPDKGYIAQTSSKSVDEKVKSYTGGFANNGASEFYQAWATTDVQIYGASGKKISREPKQASAYYHSYNVLKHPTTGKTFFLYGENKEPASDKEIANKIANTFSFSQ